MPTRIREAAATKDGLPRKAFAYAPTAKPDDWKLPIYKADGSVDADRLPGAAAALSEGGFRGQKADIPASALANVKARLRSAYRKWKGSDAEYPDSIAEVEAVLRESADGVGVTIREAVVLLDKSAACATVISMPNGDMVVIPNYDGQFQNLAKPYKEPGEPNDSWQTPYDVQDAANTLATLTRLRQHEMDDPAQVAMLDGAISRIADFMKSEATEPMSETGITDDAALAHFEEVGKRNSAKDQKTIQNMHDLSHDLGAEHTAGRSYAGMAESDAPPFMAAIEYTSKDRREMVFAEAAGDEGTTAFVLLSEAAATFDRANRTVTITPIKPGFGNRRDKFFYPAETLKEATVDGLFDHLKMFRNHPRKSDEKDLPERDVNDWFATTREAKWDDATQTPRVEVKVHDLKDFDRWEEAPEQVAFSVRGGGFARDGRVDGQEARIVESLAKVKSVDWVTEAGAGGAIMFAESAADEEKFEMDLKALSTDQLREELRLREAEGETTPAGDAPAGDAAADAAATTPAADAAPEATPAADAAADKPAEDAPAAEPGTVSEAAIAAAVEKALADRDAAASAKIKVQEAAKAAITDEIGKSTLIKGVKDAVAVRFAEAGWGNGFTYTDEPALRGAVQGELAQAARLLAAAGKAPSAVKGLGTESGEGSASISEAAETRIADRWGADQTPRKPKLVYDVDELSGATVAEGKGKPGDDGGKPADMSESATDAATGRIAARMGLRN